VTFLLFIYNLSIDYRLLHIRTLILILIPTHHYLAELRLPGIANCNSCCTARRDSISMVRVRFPSHGPVTCHIDILILDNRSGCEAYCPKPQRIGSCIVNGRKCISIICIPVSQGRDIA
jgi:hypothetical protein